MLKSFVQTPPREMLLDRARRLLEEDEVEELRKTLDKVIKIQTKQTMYNMCVY